MSYLGNESLCSHHTGVGEVTDHRTTTAIANDNVLTALQNTG